MLVYEKYEPTILSQTFALVHIKLKCDFAYFIPISSQVATEKDFLDAIQKVVKAYAKFSATPKYMTYN